jgi:hypothetical protein
LDRHHESRVVLACTPLALLVLVALVTHVLRLGDAIAREVHQAQVEYMQAVGDGLLAEDNAVLLGQCLRAAMLRSARAGFDEPDTWAPSARMAAMPACASALPPTPKRRGPVIRTLHERPFMTFAPAGAEPATASA